MITSQLHATFWNKSTSPSTPALWPINKEDVVSGNAPLDHITGFITILTSFCLGSKLVVTPECEVESFWQSVHDWRITASTAGTFFGYKLLNYIKQKRATGELGNMGWDLSCFKFLTCVGAKLTYVDLVWEIQQILPQLRVTQTYGCTETGFIASLPVDLALTNMTAAGRLYPGFLAKIIDQQRDEPASVGQTGELCVYSESMFTSYKCHPDDNAAEIYALCHDTQGFYKTGDLVHLDENDLIHVHGRIKETLFLAGGWKITPAELEQIINEHPMVEESAIVGVSLPSTVPGCVVPKAFVKMVKNVPGGFITSNLSSVADDIYKFVAKQTAEPKHLVGGVRFVDEFPRIGPLRKVDRKKLRDFP